MLMASISSIIGESDMMFSFNEHLLVRRVQRQTESGQQILELQWYPILYDDIVEKLLVCIRDVTEFEQLNLKNRKTQCEVEVVQAILAHQESPLVSIINDVHEIKNNTNAMDLTLLKNKLHTLKGNARALQLKTLSSEIHNIETRLETNQSSVTIVSAHNMLNPVFGLLENISSVYNKTLDRSNSSEDLCSILCQSFKALESSLALLQKPLPVLEVLVHHFILEPKSAQILMGALNHILTNMMCHSIEAPNERVQSAKPKLATIKMRTLDRLETHDHFKIILVDDGRGLNITKLAQQQHIHFNDLVKTDMQQAEQAMQKCAESIFNAGLSTAAHVSELSGRGVGMSAVRESLANVGASIELQFNLHDLYCLGADDADSQYALNQESQHQDFRIEYFLPFQFVLTFTSNSLRLVKDIAAA